MSSKNRHMSKKIDIGLLFISDYSSVFSGREIARRMRISPQAALNVIKEMVNNKFLQFEVKGRVV